MSNNTITHVSQSESKQVGDNGETITVSVSTKESHQTTVEGPESHSVHTLKSTKVVVEENKNGKSSQGKLDEINDPEVEQLMKRVEKQRNVLDEILTKEQQQPEGTS
jgi:hypothetical protein